LDEGLREDLGKLIRYFTKKVKGPSVRVKFQRNGGTEEWLAIQVATEQEINAWRI